MAGALTRMIGRTPASGGGTTIDLNFGTGSYTSAGTTYGSFSAYLTGTGSTFTRGSSGTYFDGSGVLQTASSNVARINCDPANSNAVRGLLIEPSATNQLGNSEVFGSWTTTNLTVNSNAVAAPDGNTTADKLTEPNTTAEYHQIQQASNSTITSNTNTTYSAFVKAAERTKLTLLMSNVAFSNWLFRSFDLSAVSVGAAQFAGSGWTDLGASIVSVGGGFYRVMIAGKYGTSDSIRGWLEIEDASGNRTYAGVTGDGFYAWGAQLETGVIVPSSYIATPTSSSVTRSADAFTIAIPTGTHDLTFTFDDGSTQVITGQSGNYAVPTNLNRPNIKRITAP